jgi:hypothetical protein
MVSAISFDCCRQTVREGMPEIANRRVRAHSVRGWLQKSIWQQLLHRTSMMPLTSTCGWICYESILLHHCSNADWQEFPAFLKLLYTAIIITYKTYKSQP